MWTRSSKVILVFAVALYSTLVVFNNVTDYASNFQFVSHVLRMDTTFPGNKGLWRSIHVPAVHHAAYLFIIVVEGLVAVLCWIGTLRLYRTIDRAHQFHRAKGVAICGVTVGVFLWFTGFLTIGGEWFLMWQSERWNGQQAAFRLAAIFGIVLVYLVLPEREDDA